MFLCQIFERQCGCYLPRGEPAESISVPLHDTGLEICSQTSTPGLDSNSHRQPDPRCRRYIAFQTGNVVSYKRIESP